MPTHYRRIVLIVDGGIPDAVRGRARALERGRRRASMSLLAAGRGGTWQRLDELGRALAADAAAQSRDPGCCGAFGVQ